MHSLAILLVLLCTAIAGILLLRLADTRARQVTLQRMDILLAAPGAASSHVPAEESQGPQLLSQQLARAGWEPDRRQLVLLAASLAAVTLVALLAGGVLAAILVASTLMLAGLAALQYRGAANMRLLSNSMLGFLERIRQLLSVGHSLPVALRRATENSPPVVARCLAPTLRRIDNGASVAESIERCAADFDLYELHLLATATRTNLRFGGSMTSILKNIMENIRRRTAIERELRSNTTQIRASAWVLALLPLIVASMVMLTNRGYARWFLATPAGHAMLAYAAVSQLLGALCMRVIVRTRF